MFCKDLEERSIETVSTVCYMPTSWWLVLHTYEYRYPRSTFN